MSNANLRRCAAAAVFCGSLLVGALPQGVQAADFAVAEIVDAQAKVIGAAQFEQAPNGVVIDVKLAGAAPGWHGIHLHGTGSCSPDFKAAKGHINPQAKQHGLRNPDGPDNGDLPNLYVNADGSAAVQFHTTRVSIQGGGAAPALLDADGSAIVVHDSPDDHLTQPIGGAGGRVGCGVVVADAERLSAVRHRWRWTSAADAAPTEE